MGRVGVDRGAEGTENGLGADGRKIRAPRLYRVRRPEGRVLPDGRRGRTGGRLLPGGIV